MTELERKALLPAGLRDVLPPAAAHEARLIERLTACFAAHGYERVKPPLVEFEDGLLAGAGKAMAGETFRLMDPVSQRMMGVRTDITTQVARIALTRLVAAPRPLRLSYAGEVLRVKGTQLRPERQFAQVGVELIGSDAASADAEIILLAAEALAAVGARGFSVDITVPPLVPALLDALVLTPAQHDALRAALDHKDTAAVKALGASAATTLCALIAATGPAKSCFAMLATLPLSAAAAVERERLGRVLALLAAAAPDLPLTIDPIENRGFEYHSGIGFTIFARGVRGEIGSGGRYVASLNGGAEGEAATGFTLYVDTLLRMLPPPEAERRVLLPAAAPAAVTAGLREAGWVTVAALEPVADAAEEARRLGCGHVLIDGEPRAVAQGKADG